MARVPRAECQRVETCTEKVILKYAEDTSCAFSQVLTIAHVWKLLQAGEKYTPKGLEVIFFRANIGPGIVCVLTNQSRKFS